MRNIKISQSTDDVTPTTTRAPTYRWQYRAIVNEQPNRYI